jgi:hypothetical protein
MFPVANSFKRLVTEGSSFNPVSEIVHARVRSNLEDWHNSWKKLPGITPDPLEVAKAKTNDMETKALRAMKAYRAEKKNVKKAEATATKMVQRLAADHQREIEKLQKQIEEKDAAVKEAEAKVVAANKETDDLQIAFTEAMNLSKMMARLTKTSTYQSASAE